MGKTRVLITGSNGLVGSALVKQLSENFEVYSINRSPLNNIIIDNVTNINIDITSEEFSVCINKINPQIFIHCAAQIPTSKFPDSQELADLNEAIDEAVLAVIINLNCWLIYMSSTIVYGISEGVNEIDESSELKCTTYYGKQKIASEKKIVENIKKGLILRLNAPYGPNYKTETVLTNFIKLAKKNEPLKFHGTGGRMQDFTHTKDIALFISNLINNGLKNGIYNISYGKPISMKSLATKIVKITNSSSFVGASGIKDPQEGYKASYSTQKAFKEFNWNPMIDIDNGIKGLI